MKKQNTIYRTVDHIAETTSKIGAFLSISVLFIMTAHIILEIILRSVFNTSTYILDEMVGYGVAAMTFLSLGYAYRNNSLIRVNILLATLKNTTVKKMIELFCVGIALFASAFIFRYFYLSVMKHLSRGSRSETIAEVPLWIPEVFVCIALAIFIIELLRRVLGVILDQEENVMINSEGAE